MAVEVIEAKVNPVTALARFADVRNLMADFPAEKFIRCFPTVFQERSDLYRPAALIVTVDPEDKREVYDSPERNGMVCLRARKLEQIGGAIGVRWLKTEYDRDDERVTASVYAEVLDGVGDYVPLSASATEYLTERKGRTVSTFPDEKAQTRARAKVIKYLTGLPTSFTKPELAAKNFVGLRWVLDDTIPEVRTARIAAGTQAAGRVFGHVAAEKAIDAGHEGPDDAEAPLEGEVVEQPETPAESETPTGSPQVIEVASVSKKSGGPAAKPWTKYTITSTDGETFGTFSKTHADAALQAKAAGVAVVVRFTVTEYGNDLDRDNGVTRVDEQ